MFSKLTRILWYTFRSYKDADTFHSSHKNTFSTGFASCLLQSVYYCPEFSVGCSAGLRAIINSYLLTVAMWMFAGGSPGWHIHSSLKGFFINMRCGISQVASGWFLALSQYLFQNLGFFVDGGYFAKRIVFPYCFLEIWCHSFEDTSCSLSKLRVLPSCWPLPEVAWGQEGRRLAGPKPAWQHRWPLTGPFAASQPQGCWQVSCKLCVTACSFSAGVLLGSVRSNSLFCLWPVFLLSLLKQPKWEEGQAWGTGKW